MGTMALIHQVDGAQRLTTAIDQSIAEGRLGLAHEQAVLLVKVLDSQQVPTCLDCGMAMTHEEIDRYTSWCDEHAPALGLRFEE